MRSLCDRVQHCLRSRRAEEHSGPVWWAYMLLLLAIAVLILLLSIALLVVKPKVPEITVRSQLKVFLYDPAQEMLIVELDMSPVLENHNTMLDLTLSQVNFVLRFNGTPLMKLASVHVFDVPRKAAIPLYFHKLVGITLDHAGRAAVEEAIKSGLVHFTVTGEARTEWKMGEKAIKTWTRLHCGMTFLWPSGTSANIDCETSIFDIFL